MNTLRLIFVICLLGTAGARAGSASPLTLVNPLQGTDSNPGYSHGNEYPAIALPFPMNTWAPYTRPVRDSFYYQYHDTKIRGIRQTHQPSPWIGDYAAFALMPVSGKLAVKEDDRASDFRHEDETAQPSYYRVHLDTWKTVAEVTPTERCARFRFTFEQARRLLRGARCLPGRLVGGDHSRREQNHRHQPLQPRRRAGQFRQLLRDRLRPAVLRPRRLVARLRPGRAARGSKASTSGAYLKFDTGAGKVVGCKVASSFISPEQALRNLQREIGDADFDTIRQRAEERWNEALGRVRIEGGLEDQRRTFYSALYRSILYPAPFLRIQRAATSPVYFSPYDGKVHEGVLYTDSGFWDTFRAAHPLYNLLFPEISAEILQGLLNAYDQSGWLPSWASPGHRDCMIGNHAFSLLADGWVKGIRSFDAQKAVTAMVHDANTQAPRYCRSIGRDGAEYYNKLGYVPYSSVARRAQLRRGHGQDARVRLRRFLRRPARAGHRPQRRGRAVRPQGDELHQPLRRQDRLHARAQGRRLLVRAFRPDRMGRALHRRLLVALDLERVPGRPRPDQTHGRRQGLCRQARRRVHLAQHLQARHLRQPHPRDGRDGRARHGPIRPRQRAHPSHDLPL